MVFCQLEDGSGYEKIVLSTYAEKVKSVVIGVPMPSVSNRRTPCYSVILYSGIEVTEDDQFVSCCNEGDEIIQLSVEFVFHRFIRGGGVDSDE